MAQLFSIKKGALLPSQVWTLTSSVDFDIDAADSVKFVYRLRDSDDRTEVTLAVISSSPKRVQLDLTEGMVATEGVYQCQVEVTIDGELLPIPHIGFDTFVVSESI